MMHEIAPWLVGATLLLLFLWPRKESECTPPPPRKRNVPGCGCDTCQCNGEVQTRKENK